MKFIRSFASIILFAVSACAMSHSHDELNIKQFNVEQFWMNYSIFVAVAK
jgi:hypothetical protein